MTPVAIFFAALILLSVLGLLIWAWFSMARVEMDLRSLGGFQDMHFQIGPQAAAPEGVRWRTRG